MLLLSEYICATWDCVAGS